MKGKAARTVTAEEKPPSFGRRRVSTRFGAGTGAFGGGRESFFKKFRLARIAVSVCLSSTYPPLSPTQDKKRLPGLKFIKILAFFK